jgi:hypothetical protein
MTIPEILDQAKALSPHEQEELAWRLFEMLDQEQTRTEAKTGAEIVQMLATIPPIEFVDADIEDPVAWVKAQRRKRAKQLEQFRDDDV